MRAFGNGRIDSGSTSKFPSLQVGFTSDRLAVKGTSNLGEGRNGVKKAKIEGDCPFVPFAKVLKNSEFSNTFVI